jgi:hypothetical protein
VEAWKLKRNVPPMAITTLLLVTAHFTEVTFLRPETLIKWSMSSWPRHWSDIVKVAV